MRKLFVDEIKRPSGENISGISAGHVVAWGSIDPAVTEYGSFNVSSFTFPTNQSQIPNFIAVFADSDYAVASHCNKSDHTRGRRLASFFDTAFTISNLQVWNYNSPNGVSGQSNPFPTQFFGDLA